MVSPISISSQLRWVVSALMSNKHTHYTYKIFAFTIIIWLLQYLDLINIFVGINKQYIWWCLNSKQVAIDYFPKKYSKFISKKLYFKLRVMLQCCYLVFSKRLVKYETTSQRKPKIKFWFSIIIVIFFTRT